MQIARDLPFDRILASGDGLSPNVTVVDRFKVRRVAYVDGEELSELKNRPGSAFRNVVYLCLDLLGELGWEMIVEVFLDCGRVLTEERRETGQKARVLGLDEPMRNWLRKQLVLSNWHP